MTDTRQLTFFELAVAPAPPQRTTAETLKLMNEALGEVGIFGRFAGIFQCMEWAEEEIALTAASHPKAAHEIRDCFLPLCPNEAIASAPELVYRAHARELLERIPAGKALAEGTSVEIMWAIMEASLKSPLTADAVSLMHKLFVNTFGRDLAAERGLSDYLGQSYEGALDDLLLAAKRVTYSKARRENWDAPHKIPKNRATGAP